MSVQRKILLVLTIVVLTFVAGLTVYKMMEDRRFRLLADQRAAERGLTFDRFLEERGDDLKALVEDSTNWDDLIRALMRKDSAWLDGQINQQTLATYKVNAVWVYQPDWQLFYSLNNRYSEELRDLPLPPEHRSNLLKSEKSCHFFVAMPHGWLEVRGGSIHPSLDRYGATKPGGYLFAGHFWIDENVRQAAAFTGYNIRIIPREEMGDRPLRSQEEEGRITFYRALNGWDGAPAAYVEVANDSPMIRALNRSSRALFYCLIALSVLLLVIIAFPLWHWVQRPLQVISRSLERNDLPPLQKLSKRGDEFGRLSSLILRSRLTEEALERTETELRHAQKLEAVGRLAGGVAHDFNNLLTAIIGYSQLLEERLQNDPTGKEHAHQIWEAGERAASLTKQLLAFSRKQLLQPRVLDVNGLIGELQKLLNRIIGERIKIVLELATEELRVRADPTQLEQVMLNLGVNARDAMTDGGTLTISTGSHRAPPRPPGEHEEQLAPGDYVVIGVSDTGIGMSEEVAAKIFEPFFTTKGPGHGTGLGLSTVYGIVKQSSGGIEVKSQPGEGTAFCIYLPRVDAPVDVVPPPPPIVKTSRAETLAVVEDDEIVRTLVCTVLTDCGYRVLCFGDPLQALENCRDFPEKIDLLVTDVVMPHMHGPALACALQGIRPDMKVLYISGYSENDISDQGVIAPEIEVLQKPFTHQTLVHTVRLILDGHPAPLHPV